MRSRGDQALPCVGDLRWGHPTVGVNGKWILGKVMLHHPWTSETGAGCGSTSVPVTVLFTEFGNGAPQRLKKML